MFIIRKYAGQNVDKIQTLKHTSYRWYDWHISSQVTFSQNKSAKHHFYTD